MLLSLDYLRQNYGIELSAETLGHRLTMAGLELDDIISVAPEFSGVIVAEVIGLEKHPDADKLNIATVNTGSEALQIVCGAPNVAVGIKVPLAQIGAKLPNDLNIKKGKLRGVESFGMLCSAKELGLSEESSGLHILPNDAPIGMDIREYLQLNDKVLDINVTPNRGDCFSIRGLVREISVLFPEYQIEYRKSAEHFNAPNYLTIQNSVPNDCPIYYGLTIQNVNIQAKTPDYMARLLERSGIRTHDPIVDITNFVMLQLGTPLHAFDSDKISGNIHIRRATDGEKLRLLNGQEALLNPEFLLIADDDKALAIAGVMGGEVSACSETTKNIFLESAWFNPITVAGKARALNLSSDACQRFERGVDFKLQKEALFYASQLILEICGGEILGLEEFIAENHFPKRETIHLNYADIEKRLGRNYEKNQIESIFKALGCEIKTENETFKVLPPSWRFDLTIPEDLIEEIARIDGYENIPDQKQAFTYQSFPKENTRLSADILKSLGYHEAITYSFIDPELQSAFQLNQKAINVQNPISSYLSQMRLSLLPALIQAVQYNRNRQQMDFRLFEIGRVFYDLNHQPYRIAGVLSGLMNPENQEHKRKADFYDAKEAVEALLYPQQAEFIPTTAPYLHPNKSADVILNGDKIGVVGSIHPELLKELGIKGGEIYAFELNQEALFNHHLIQYQSLAKFPSVRRDLALLVDKKVSAGDLIQTIKQTAGDLLQDCYCFDVYQHESLGEKQSLALALILQNPERTLNDEEIHSLLNAVMEKLNQQFGAVLR